MIRLFLMYFSFTILLVVGVALLSWLLPIVAKLFVEIYNEREERKR